MMCAMRFRHEIVYAAPPEAVFAMLRDPAFREAACAAQHVVSAEVTVTERPDGFTLVIDQVQPTTDLPAFARTFAGASAQAIQREEWAVPTRGTLDIESPGKPASATGTITLQPEGSGTREVVELEIRVKVPLVGGRLEKLMGEKITAGMNAEHAVGVDYLEGSR